MAQDVVVADIQEMPVSGRDYPRTWEQFLDWFADNDAGMSIRKHTGKCKQGHNDAMKYVNLTHLIQSPMR